MIPAPRLRHALLVLFGAGGLALPAALSSGCGPEPIGVEACRKIESARCSAAAACGFSEEDVDDCKLLYADQCLHGIENSEHRPTETETNACVAAIAAAGECAAAGETSMTKCDGAPLAAGVIDRAPCEIVLSRAHELAACAFVVAAPDAGTTTTTTTTTDSSSDTADSADAADD